jgi:hypothetical protein
MSERKKRGCHNQGRHGLLFQEKKNVIKGDDEKTKYILETKDFYNYQRNKEQFGLSIQIQKQVPQ